MAEAWLWSTWVKADRLKDADVAVVAACLPFVNPKLHEEISRGEDGALRVSGEGASGPIRQNSEYDAVLASQVHHGGLHRRKSSLLSATRLGQ
jgi:hypothetical protein